MRLSEGSIHIECLAPEELFLDNWLDYPDVAYEVVENGPIPCEGSDIMGIHCEDCRFGQVEIDYD